MPERIFVTGKPIPKIRYELNKDPPTVHGWPMMPPDNNRRKAAPVIGGAGLRYNGIEKVTPRTAGNPPEKKSKPYVPNWTRSTWLPIYRNYGPAGY